MIEVFVACALGLAIGFRHALEPDHLAAVTTLVATRRNGTERALLGAAWGFGHTLALLGVGALLLMLRLEMPEGIAKAFEVGVAGMLVFLGGRTLLTPSKRVPERRPRDRRAPLAIGFVHGLAGSGALTVLAVSAMPSVGLSLVYIVVFGIGSIAGMALLSLLLGWPLARWLERAGVERVVRVAAGSLSIVVGLMWGYAAIVP